MPVAAWRSARKYGDDIVAAIVGVSVADGTAEREKNEDDEYVEDDEDDDVEGEKKEYVFRRNELKKSFAGDAAEGAVNFSSAIT